MESWIKETRTKVDLLLEKLGLTAEEIRKWEENPEQTECSICHLQVSAKTLAKHQAQCQLKRFVPKLSAIVCFLLLWSFINSVRNMIVVKFFIKIHLELCLSLLKNLLLKKYLLR